MQARLKALGKDVSELIRGRDPDESKVTILNRFMREVLPNVDMLASGSLSTTDDVVTPFDARVVVLVYRRVSHRQEPHVLEQCTKVDDLHSSR